jgi:CheY-like chemotaxis protein/signal transduction histidine kinase
MPTTEPIVLQSVAAAAWGAAGVAAMRRYGATATAPDFTLGCGLLTGAIIMGIDTFTAGTLAMPLASWALLAFAAIAQLPGKDSALRSLCASNWRLALTAIGAFLLLHWVHTTAPQQPVLDWGTHFLPLNLLAAATLGWLALRPPTTQTFEHSSLLTGAQRGTLLGATATGLAFAAFGGSASSDLVALFQVAAVLPLLRPVLFESDRIVNVGMATAIAATIPLVLRATCIANHDFGMATTLLATSVLFVAFGVAVGLPTGMKSSHPAEERTTNNANTLAEADYTAIAGARHDSGFLSMHALSTDLRAPITSILAAADLLGDATDRKEREDHLGIIHAQVHQLAASLADMEDFERLLAGELEFAHDTFGLSELLHYSIGDTAAAAEQRGIELRIDLASDLPRWTQGDASRLRQLTTRMLELAVRHSNLGPVDLSASFQDGLLHLVVQNQCPSTQLDSFVSDDAGHVPNPEHGVGLNFCRHLAMAMGGDLSITARPEDGATIHATVALAVAPEWEVEIAEEDAQRPKETTDTPDAIKGHVLLVDDSRDHQRLLGHLLTRAGATVTTADNGAIALHLMQNQDFDLILMDMQMPEMDGIEATQELRRRGVNTPVLALTADNGEGSTERFLAAGCNGHLEKPIDRDALHRLLSMYLPASTTN